MSFQKLKSKLIFPISWCINDKNYTDGDPTIICLYGLDENNNNVYLKITGYNPYIWIELPNFDVAGEPIIWDYNLIQKARQYFTGKEVSLKNITYEKRKKLYGYHVKDYKEISFLKIHITNSRRMHIINKYKCDKPVGTGYRKVVYKVHEHSVPIFLKMCTERKINTCNWIKYKHYTKLKNKSTYCDEEYRVDYRDLYPTNYKKLCNPLIMSFDIETYSSNDFRMPDHNCIKDKIIQISCVIERINVKNTREHILLTIGPNLPKNNISKDKKNNIEYKYTVINCVDESDLILNYVKLLIDKNINIIIGYNILTFDIDYMYKRAKYLGIEFDFLKQGFHKTNGAVQRQISWSSTAYKSQEFFFVQPEGRVVLDVFKLIQRDHSKLSSFKLNYVSEHFLSSSKDDLEYITMFRYYEDMINEKIDINKRIQKSKIIGEYCIKDSILTLDLFNKLKYFIYCSEMANTCNIMISDIMLRGQQFKVFCQVYKYCYNNNIIVENITNTPDIEYQGATVFAPEKLGIYDKVIPFDFASLYPTTIIAYNIDYTTLVKDHHNVKDEDCHIIKWDTHIGCKHDLNIRKSKITKVICKTGNKLRFLKSPKGVLPTILENLLNFRKKTKIEIKKLKKQLKSYKLNEPDSQQKKDNIISFETDIDILDKRQLAIKLSANSVYGSMGVKKGYLPFIQGAQATTAMGRQNIKRAADELRNVHGAKLVYGDSVVKDTPILCKDTLGNINICRIDDISNNWSNYPGFKLNDNQNRTNKLQSTPHQYKYIFTNNKWVKIIRVIKHKVNKQLFRINTHTACIDVTEDHSLIDQFYNPVKPSEVKIGDKLLHTFPKKFNEMFFEKPEYKFQNINCNKCKEDLPPYEYYYKKLGKIINKTCKRCQWEYNKKYSKGIRKGHTRYFSGIKYLHYTNEIMTVQKAWVWGLFMGDGSCGKYENTNTKWNKYSWAINNNNLKFLEKAKSILEIEEPEFNFKILDTIKSSGVYKLVPSGRVQYIVMKWRELFYDKEKYKIVPKIILNSPKDIRMAYFKGYLTADGNKTFGELGVGKEAFACKGKIGSQCLYYLVKSLGYKYVSINNINSKENTYMISISKIKFNKDPIAIKKIIKLPDSEEYVYDIETEDGTFNGGIGELTISNTDSALVSFPKFNNIDEKEAYKLWDHSVNVAKEVTKLFPKPMELEFEDKIYWKFFIISKKRYMNININSRDGEVDKDKIQKKGVLLTRRDISNYVKKIYEKIMDVLFNENKNNYKKLIENIIIDSVQNIYKRQYNPDLVNLDKFFCDTDFKINKSVSNYPHIIWKDLFEGNTTITLDSIIKDRIIEKDIEKGMFASYKVKILPNNYEDKLHQYNLKLLNINECICKNNSTVCIECLKYYVRCMPAPVQLAIDMCNRGTRVDNGSRLEYIVHKNKQCEKLFDKIKDYKYYLSNKYKNKYGRIDELYYIKSLINPVNEILNIIHDDNKQELHKKNKYCETCLENNISFYLNIVTKNVKCKKCYPKHKTIIEKLYKLFKCREIFNNNYKQIVSDEYKEDLLDIVQSKYRYKSILLPKETINTNIYKRTSLLIKFTRRDIRKGKKKIKKKRKKKEELPVRNCKVKK